MNSEWSRGERIALGSLLVAIAAIIVALFIPELRRMIGLRVELNSNASQPTLDVPVSAVSNRSSAASPREAPKSELSRGDFQVSATSARGSTFVNPYNKHVTILFQASGNWTFWNAAGFHSASGHAQYPTGESQYPIPAVSCGSLVVRRGNGAYEYVGEERTLMLSPKEQLIFRMNDDETHGVGFTDNRGSITVSWTCQDC